LEGTLGSPNIGFNNIISNSSNCLISSQELLIPFSPSFSYIIVEKASGNVPEFNYDSNKIIPSITSCNISGVSLNNETIKGSDITNGIFFLTQPNISASEYFINFKINDIIPQVTSCNISGVSLNNETIKVNNITNGQFFIDSPNISANIQEIDSSIIYQPLTCNLGNSSINVNNFSTFTFSPSSLPLSAYSVNMSGWALNSWTLSTLEIPASRIYISSLPNNSYKKVGITITLNIDNSIVDYSLWNFYINLRHISSGWENLYVYMDNYEKIQNPTIDLNFDIPNYVTDLTGEWIVYVNSHSHFYGGKVGATALKLVFI
jgi:hypothetical protein